MNELVYPASKPEYERIVADVGQHIDLDSRLPDWPFTAPTGYVNFCEYDDAIQGPFGPVLQALTAEYGDRSVSFTVLEPSPTAYFFHYFGSYPAFSIPPALLSEYWDVVSHRPGGDPTGAVTDIADTVAIVGDGGRWAVWGERRWGLALVLTEREEGPWTRAGLDFVNVHDALDWFTEPPYKTPLDPAAREAFLANVRSRGSGPR